MTPNLVSVVLPTYNNKATIGLAVSSVLLQKGCDFELIVVDDGSTDGTSRILSAFATADPRVRVIRLSRCSGEGIARNTGIQAARGTYVAMQDGDDISLPGRLSRQLQFLLSNPDVDWVSTWGYTMSPSYHLMEVAESPLDHEAIRAQLVTGKMSIVGASALTKRDALNQCGGYRALITPDFDLARRFVQTHRIAAIPEPLYAFFPVLPQKQSMRYRAASLLMLRHLKELGTEGVGPAFLAHLFWNGLQGFVPFANRSTLWVRKLTRFLNQEIYSQEFDEWFSHLRRYETDVCGNQS